MNELEDMLNPLSRISAQDRFVEAPVNAWRRGRLCAFSVASHAAIDMAGAN